jgi:adenosine deaminase
MKQYLLLTGWMVILFFGRLEAQTVDYSRLPKIELHLHLDCSLSYAVVKRLDPSVTEEEYRRSFIAPAKCLDLKEYIARADREVGLMQTAAALRLVTLDVMRQLKEDHVIYAELRFAPLKHLEKGLTPEQVVRAVNDAVTEGMRKTGVSAGIILCTLRHFSEEQSMETVKLAEEFRGTHVVGFDIAANEAGFPVTNHIKAYAYAHEKGISCTAHAGEAKGAESVWETLRTFHPSRIGHGVRSIEDTALISYLKKEDILLEICPTSNIQTNIYDRIEDHPADKLYKSGVPMNINTDCRTISNVTLSSEYATLHRIFGWDREEFLRCNLAAVAHSFTGPEEKVRLVEELVKGYADIVENDKSASVLVGR